MRTKSLKVLGLGWMILSAVACGGDSPAPRLPTTDADVAVDAGIPDNVVVTPSPDAGTIPWRPFQPPPPEGTKNSPGEVQLDGGPGGAGPDGGVPPVSDLDGDTISDADEGAGAVDTDNDGTPDHLDTDSDGDGVLDRDEAGDPDLLTAPVDSDQDGTPDFRDLDSDQDGILDAQEGLQDPDGDGRPAFIDLDSDGDAIDDAVEGITDSDRDGRPDFLDLDTDDDGILDLVETANDFDDDGVGNWRDLDSDQDGILDAQEGLQDPDGDGRPAFIDLDADDDTLSDAFEGVEDLDGDGLGAWIDEDSDGDTIRDADERLEDPDDDGIPAYLDLDSDNDLIPDALEAGDADPATPPADPDGDGVISALDLDADDDGILDSTEGASDQDGDGTPSFHDLDTDGDGILDSLEAGDADLQTPPVDTDGDGAPDYADTDSDNDLIADSDEGTLDSDGDGTPDFRDRDADDDGRSDTAEAGDVDPTTPPIDTDGDGQADFRDIDADGDGFGDAAETGCPTSTEHLVADSDGDGLVDPIEVAVQTDPCDAASIVSGLFFVLPPLAPTDSAPLPFNQTDIDRADLALNVDTTGSMGGEIDTLRNSLTSLIIPGLQATVSQPGFAVTSFEDYPVAPFGAVDVEDRPFRLLTRVTTNAAAAQTAVNNLQTRSGQDRPESGLESLYQIATGAGTAWGPLPSERVQPFDGAVGLFPGVADGMIGGVGFRDGALPIIVHVTDSTSHFAPTYRAVDPNITAVATSSVRAALTDIRARVISVASARLPRPVAASQTDQWFADSCQRRAAQFFGRIDSPRATDVDWYELTGATASATVEAEVTAARIGSTLDSVLAVYDGSGTRLALNDDFQAGVSGDSQVVVTLSGPPPYYVAVSSYNDLDFNGSDAETSGYYFLDITVGGVGYVPDDPTCPGTDLGTDRASATPLTTLANAPAAPEACERTCSAEIADEPLALPYGIAQSTGASIPPCAWDEFGARPVNCGVDQCCTGPGGLGQATNAAGLCPLAFEVGSDGTGLGDAIVTGLEALVSFSSFTFTTRVRTDPDAPIDTRCFIHQVVPETAVAPNTCAPTPTETADGWSDVVPGTELSFRIDAKNEVAGGAEPCFQAQRFPVAFRAFIDVLADEVTVVDTRPVTIVVPGDPALAGD